MDPIEEYETLKRSLARKREEESRREGSIEASERRLKEEYGVSVKQAEKEVVSLRKKVERLEDECAEKVQEIKEVIGES